MRYDYARAAQIVERELLRPAGDLNVFRYWPLLPVTYREGSGEIGDLPRTGGTPYREAPSLALRLGLESLMVKDETANPSGCLKDRATVVAVEMARAQNTRELCCASAGNAALSLAHYCARVGLACHVYLPHGIAKSRLDALRACGADVHVSSGDYDQAYDEAARACELRGWYSRSCAVNPFLVEGKKTVSFEIAEQAGWRVPDAVVAPVGDGCTLAAVGKGFRELVLVGLTGAVPRLIGVQAEPIQPLVRRFRGEAHEVEEGSTRATSIAVRRPRNTTRLLDEVRRSQGTMLAVTDEETAAAQELLFRETGIRAEFSSATALAGLIRLGAKMKTMGIGSVALVVTGGERAEP